MSTIREKRYIDYSDIEKYYSIKEEAMVKSKRKKCKNQSTCIQLKYFVYGGIIFMLALGMIFNYALITQTKMEIHDLSREIDLLSKQKEDMTIALETIKNSNVIEENAMNFLGMDYAKSHQNQMVSVNFTGVLDNNFAYNHEKESAFFESLVEKTFALLKNEGI
jgi:cell division protein FtsL